MKTFYVLLLVALVSVQSLTQTSADSVTITFRAYATNTTTLYLPGEFNNWGNNSGGNISPSDPSRMLTYNTPMGCWIKTYTFKRNDPTDNRRTIADTVFQYKLNNGGGSNGWYSDPLNPLTNGADNGNSVLKMGTLFWFEYNQVISGSNITRITAGLVHRNSNTISSVVLSYGASSTSSLTSRTMTAAYNTSTRIFDTTLATVIPKNDYIRLVARNDNGDSTVLAAGGYNWSTIPMPSYVQNGVTLPSVASNDSTSFRLRVPNKSYVLVRIAPVGQPVSTATPIVMNHNTDNDNWWVNVKLAAGTYEYVYEIENGKQIYDPWGRLIGTNGTRFTVGSAGLTADDYNWRSTNFQRPPLDKLVIYEMNMAEEAGGYYNLPSGQAKFHHLRDMMPYFDTLGINAIELLPVTDYGNIGSSGFSWGYDINSYLALEPSFGTPADYKELIDSAHTHGIAVIMDVVYNHLNSTSSLWQMLPDESLNPYFKLCNDLKPNEDNLCFFQDMDYWTPVGSFIYSEELVYTALKMWIDDYHIDGFRYDYTEGIGWSRYDSTKGVLGFTDRIAHDYNNSIYQISEHLPESPALLYYSGLTSSWHGNFREKLKGESDTPLSISMSDLGNYVLGLGSYGTNDTPSTPISYQKRTQPINDCSNHDEQSLLYEMIHYAHVDTETAIKRDKLYSTFMFTSLGVPMLWEGTEFGEPRGYTDDNNKLSYRPVQWNFYRTARGKSQFQHYHSLIMQRKLNPALYNGTMVIEGSYAEHVFDWGFRDSTTGTQVQIIANLDSVSHTETNVPWLSSGTWYDVYDQSIFYADSTRLTSYTVPGYTAQVFSNKSNNDLGIVLGVKNNPNDQLPKEIELSQNYPNPFNPSTTIHFDLPKRSYVSLKIFDVIGREVATVIDGERSPGGYDVQWNANTVASGIYFYRLVTEFGTQSKKLMVLR